MRMTMTKSRIDVPPPSEKRHKRIDFNLLRPKDGKVHSLHVPTAGDRARVMVAFRYWVENIARVQAHAISKKVDATDPDGPGYRIWFMSGPRDSAGAEPKGDEI